MKKKIFAAIGAVSILLSFCACAAEQPEEPVTEQTTGGQETTGIKELPEDFRWLTYEEYKALSLEEQQAYYEAFPTPEEYMVWFNAVAKEHNQTGGDSIQVDGDEGQITQPTEPDETPVTPTQKPEDPTQKPVQTPETPSETTPVKKDPVLLTYEEYLKLSPAMQQAYYESFSGMDAFMAWFNAAAEEYNKNNTPSQTEGNEGQVTQPTESDETLPTSAEETKPVNGASGLIGSASQGEVDF